MRQSLYAAILLTNAVLLARPGLADETERTIIVTGEGTVAAPPDMATIDTGVMTEGATAGDALTSNNDAMERILSVLKKHEVASKDVQTSSFNVSPQYKRGPQGQTEPEIVGYRVTNRLRVHVRKLEDLGQILDALVGAGSNQLSGISFEIADPAAVMKQARREAVADARSRAELYAEAAGVRVGKVLTIREQAVQGPRPLSLPREVAAAGVPVASGEQELRATVSIEFALEDIE